MKQSLRGKARLRPNRGMRLLWPKRGKPNNESLGLCHRLVKTSRAPGSEGPQPH
jgi:hypothetical protein